MKQYYYDFIIAYEHKSREIMSICAVKMELERNGHSVFVYYIEDKNVINCKKKYRCDVLVMPYGYDDFRIFMATRDSISYKKIVNFQWEQIFARIEEDNPLSYKTPKGLFKKYGIHISWGERNKERLIEKAGIDAQRIKVCGHMAMDFLKEPLCNIYISKNRLFKMYNIPESAKVRLFIGSFKSAFLNEKQLALYIKRFGTWRKTQHEIMLKSFFKDIEWYEKSMKSYPNDIFIYRPHPGETVEWPCEVRDKMDILKKDYPNFRIIENESVQQWILVSDWICIGGPSTSIVDAFFANKKCYILYPYELPSDIIMPIFDKAIQIKTYEEFNNSMINDLAFPISYDTINSYYGMSKDFSFFKVSEALINVHKNDNYCIPKNELKKAYKASYDEYWEGHRFIWKNRLVQSLQMLIGKVSPFPSFCRSYYLEQTINGESYKKEYVSDEEMKCIISKISECLSGE